MNPLTTSNTASERIAYALSRRQETIEPVAQENSVIEVMQANFNARVNAISEAVEEEHELRSGLSNLSMSEVEAVQPFQGEDEQLALLKDRVVRLKTQRDLLKNGLIASEEQLIQQNQSKQQLTSDLNELRQVQAMQQYWITERMHHVASHLSNSVPKNNSGGK